MYWDFFRIAFAVFMLLGAFDPKRGLSDIRIRMVPTSNRASHRHTPQVPRNLKQASERRSKTGRSIGPVRRRAKKQSKELYEIWKNAGYAGFTMAEQCYLRLAIECLTKGGMPDDPNSALMPVHALSHGGYASREPISDKVRKGHQIYEQTRATRELFVAGNLSKSDLFSLVPVAEHLILGTKTKKDVSRE